MAAMVAVMAVMALVAVMTALVVAAVMAVVVVTTFVTRCRFHLPPLLNHYHLLGLATDNNYMQHGFHI